MNFHLHASLWARSDIGAFKGVLTYKGVKKRVELEQLQSDPWTLYLYAMKLPVTRDKYQKRLGKFFEFIGLADLQIVKYFLIIFVLVKAFEIFVNVGINGLSKIFYIQLTCQSIII